MLSVWRLRLNTRIALVNLVQNKFIKIDKSKLPTLDEKDLEEHFVSGSGPGGQCVNKAVNCCNLKHLPTGINVKVHHTRSLEQNRQIARELLISRLDNLYNGENSVENQKKRIILEKLAMKRAQQGRRQKMKEDYKKSTSLSTNKMPACDPS